MSFLGVQVHMYMKNNNQSLASCVVSEKGYGGRGKVANWRRRCNVMGRKLGFGFVMGKRFRRLVLSFTAMGCCLSTQTDEKILKSCLRI